MRQSRNEYRTVRIYTVQVQSSFTISASVQICDARLKRQDSLDAELLVVDALGDSQGVARSDEEFVEPPDGHLGILRVPVANVAVRPVSSTELDHQPQLEDPPAGGEHGDELVLEVVPGDPVDLGALQSHLQVALTETESRWKKPEIKLFSNRILSVLKSKRHASLPVKPGFLTLKIPGPHFLLNYQVNSNWQEGHNGIFSYYLPCLSSRERD